MRYVYGIAGNYSNSKGRTVTVKQLASIIKRDVEYGKWNIYRRRKNNDEPAHCKYERNGFTHHEELMIYGNQKEFETLEKLITGVIKILPT